MDILNMFTNYLRNARAVRGSERRSAASTADDYQMIRIRIAGMGLSVVARLPLDEPARNEFDLLAKGLLQVARQPLSELAWDQREALEHLARLAEEQARAASPAPALTTLAQPPSGADRIGLSAAPSPVGPINLRPACS